MTEETEEAEEATADTAGPGLGDAGCFTSNPPATDDTLSTSMLEPHEVQNLAASSSSAWQATQR